MKILKGLTLPAGAGVDKVLTSDVNGNMAWVNLEDHPIVVAMQSVLDNHEARIIALEGGST